MKYLVGVIAFIMSVNVFALNNENYEVQQVDITEDVAIVWVAVHEPDSLIGRPSCDTKAYKAVSCNLGEDFCTAMISLALTAKSTGGEVDFNYDSDATQCIDNFSPAKRFRLSY